MDLAPAIPLQGADRHLFSGNPGDTFPSLIKRVSNHFCQASGSPGGYRGVCAIKDLHGLLHDPDALGIPEKNNIAANLLLCNKFISVCRFFCVRSLPHGGSTLGQDRNKGLKLKQILIFGVSEGEGRSLE